MSRARHLLRPALNHWLHDGVTVLPAIPPFDFDATLTTFTPSMALRTAPGPFTAAPIVQGLSDGSGVGDEIEVARGTQINGQFYANIDFYQTSIVFWWTPEYSTGDNSANIYLWEDNMFHLRYFFGSGSLRAVIGNQTYLLSQAVTAGTTYSIVFRWDLKNTLDGTNYGCLSIDDSHNFMATITGAAQTAATNFYIGGLENAGGQANAIIEGLTIYRRVLFDGTYGVDVGNGDELALIYNSGSGTDPTEITGSWDAVFCLPTNSTAGALVTGTGHAWSHPHSSAILDETWLQNRGTPGPWAVEFDGAATSVDCGSDASIDDLHDAAMTVEAWVRADGWGEGNQGRIVAKLNADVGDAGWNFYLHNSRGVTFWAKCATTNTIGQSDTSVFSPDGLWHHVAATWDDAAFTNPKIWIDGVEQTNTTTARDGAVVTDASYNLILGNYSTGSATFDGAIAWVRISNNIRYTADFVPPVAVPATDANTVALYAMDEGTGTSLADSSANSNTGTIVSGSWSSPWALQGTPVLPSSVEFNGTTTSIDCGSGATLDDLHDAAMTVEAWIRADSLGELNQGNIADKRGGSTGWRFFVWSTGLYALIDCASTAATSISSGTSLADGQWHHVAFTFDDAGDRKIDLFVDGIERSYSTETAGVGAITSDAAVSLFIGNNAANAVTFDGAISHVRISNNIRYTDTFIPYSRINPPGADANTVAQYDFRDGAGTTLRDETGNNDGTISNGTWNVGTELSTDAPGARIYNWGQVVSGEASYDLDLTTATFTPSMALRAAPGPFTAAPIVQGDPNNADTLTDDLLSMSRGNLVSGLWYDNFDPYQGTFIMWYTPEFDSSAYSGTGDDYMWYASGTNSLQYEYDNNRFKLTIGAQNLTVSTAISAGTTYCIVARWNVNNKLDGTNYACLSIDDSHNFGITTQPAAGAPGATMYHSGTANAANAILEGITYTRRVLFDGTYGTDVGNGDEVNLIYNSGFGTDPTSITGSWDAVFCLPTNSTAGALTTGTGHAWSHPHSSAVLDESWLQTRGTPGPWAVEFDGADTKVDCGSDASLDDLQDAAFTVEGWFRVDDWGESNGGTASTLITKSDSGASAGWVLQIDNSYGVRMYIFCATTDTWANTGTAVFSPAGLWRHIAATFDDASFTNPKLWIDGVEQTNNTQARSGAIVTDAAQSLVIGNYTNAHTFDGAIAWVRISNNIRYTADFVPPVACPATDANTVALYKCDEGTGTSLADSSANTNTGTITSGSWSSPWAQQGTPVLPSSVEFNGTTTSIDCGSGATLDDLHGAAFTAEAWVRPTKDGDTRGFIFSKGSWSSTGWGFGFYKSLDRIDYRINTDATSIGGNTGTDSFAVDSQWHHIAFTYDNGGDRKLYIYADGVLLHTSAAATGTISSDAAVNLILGDMTGQVTNFDGAISHVRISNNIRYTDTFVPYSRLNPPATDANTIAQWDFRDGAGTTLLDETANNHDGTISNGTWNITTDLATDASGARVYNWGQVIGSDAANEGISQKQTGLTAGANYVARIPISYESYDAQPRIRIYDNTNAATIVDFDGPWLTGTHDGAANAAALTDTTAPYWPASLVGGTIYNITDGSSVVITGAGDTIAGTLTGGTDNDWDASDVYMIVPPAGWVWCEPFTWELPTIARNGAAADCVSMSVQILNANSSGVLYAHQAEVQVTVIDNPSCETGSGDPWIPDGYTNAALDAGEGVQETTIVHSGVASMKLLGASAEGFTQVSNGWSGIAAGDFWAMGAWYNVTSGGVKFELQPSKWSLQYALADSTVGPFTDAAWTHKSWIGRYITSTGGLKTLADGVTTAYLDDVYAYKLTAVSLTATPASEANSTESSGIRVDGRDTLTDTIYNLKVTRGIIRFAYTPRHDAADAVKFGVSLNTPYVMMAWKNSSNYLVVNWTVANTIRMYLNVASTATFDTWDATGAIVAGTTYQIIVAYTATQCTLSVDGVVKITLTPGAGIDWGANIPTTLYYGTNNTGVYQSDATFAAPAAS